MDPRPPSPLLILTPHAAERWAWWLCDAAGVQSGECTSASLAALPGWATARRWLAVPGETVLLASVPVGPGERRVLHQSVPFRLEEQLLEEPEALHFALGPVCGDRAAVAVVAATALTQWLEALAAAGGGVAAAVPEPLLLRWQPDSWTLCVEAGRWLARLDRYSGWALEPAAARLALELALAERGPPARLLVAGEPGAGTLPPELAAVLERVEPTGQDDAATHLAQPAHVPASGGTLPVLLYSAETAPFDLLQGSFAPRLPWRRWARAWRLPAAALAAALLVQFGSAGWQLHQLRQQQDELQSAITSSYRSIVPAGRVADAEAALRERIAARRSPAPQLLPLLATAGAALIATPDVVLTALDYDDRGRDGGTAVAAGGSPRELRLALRADSYGQVEQLRMALTTAGLRVELISSGVAGDAIRADLRIRPVPLEVVERSAPAEKRKLAGRREVSDG